MKRRRRTLDILQTPETRERLPEAVTTPSITTARAGDDTNDDDDDEIMIT